jgi:hypothetical protein
MKENVETTIRIPLDEEMSLVLARVIAETVRDGYGVVEIDITPQAVRIARKTIKRIPWPKAK